MKTKRLLCYALFLLISASAFCQKSKLSLEVGAGAGYYSNIGVWGLKFNNGIDYQFSDRFSISGTLGFYQSLIDFQNDYGNNNSLSTMLVDCDLNYNLINGKHSNSLWFGVGVTYFKGVEFMENQYPVAHTIDGTYINTMGFNMKLKYKHRLSERLSGSINAETYSRDRFFDVDALLINIGYSVIYRF